MKTIIKFILFLSCFILSCSANNKELVYVDDEEYKHKRGSKMGLQDADNFIKTNKLTIIQCSTEYIPEKMIKALREEVPAQVAIEYWGGLPEDDEVIDYMVTFNNRMYQEITNVHGAGAISKWYEKAREKSGAPLHPVTSD